MCNESLKFLIRVDFLNSRGIVVESNNDNKNILVKAKDMKNKPIFIVTKFWYSDIEYRVLRCEVAMLWLKIKFEAIDN